MYQNDLLPLQTGYYTGYDREINPTVANVFATAALRYKNKYKWLGFPIRQDIREKSVDKKTSILIFA